MAYSPLPPPTPPRGLGPDAWWNPLSPSWPATAAGRAAGAWVRREAERKAAEVQATIDEAAKLPGALSPPDPIQVAAAIIGEPSWGFYVPTVGIGVLSLAVIGGGAALYVAHKKKKG